MHKFCIKHTFEYHIKCLIVTSFVGFVFQIFQADINAWLTNIWIGNALWLLYKRMMDSVLLSGIIAIALSFCLGRMAFYSYKSSAKSFFIQLLLYVIAFLVITDDYWLLPDLIPNVLNYKQYWRFALYLLGIGSFFSYGYGVCKCRFQKIEFANNGKGFVTKHCLEESNTIDKFAKGIVDRLLRTKMHEEAFSLGIAGVWGSGKTTCLEALKKEFGRKVLYIEFMPWNSNSPEKIIEDFFLLFRKEVSSQINPFLSGTIAKYARQLLSINRMDPWLALFRSLAVWYSEKDSNVFKSKIADKLKDIDSKIVVAIDDIDRLDSNELFEVLRLIRNTANLPNLIFLVTYDKDYVIKQLKNKGISNPDLYLEKIINVEVMLPKVMGYELISMLYSDLEKMVDENVVLSIMNTVGKNKKGTRTIVAILTNYREIERFAKQLAVHVAYAQENLKNEISIQDLFWLELIRYADFNFYMRLSKQVDTIFQLSKGDKKQLILDNAFKKQFEPDYADTPYTSKKVFDVLNYLFREEDRDELSMSIVYTNNYSRYFSLGLEKRKFYKFDLNKLLNGEGVDYDAVLKSFFENEKAEDNYDLNSLLFLISNIGNAELDLSLYQRIIRLLCALFKYERKNEVYRNLYDFVCDEEIIRKDNGNWTKWFLAYYEKKLSEYSGYNVAYILRNIYDTIRDIKEQNDNITKVKQLMSDNFLKWVEKEKPDAIDIIDSDSMLSEMYKENSKKLHYVDKFDNYMYSDIECWIWESILDYFKDHRSTKYKEFDEYFNYDITDEDDPHTDMTRQEEIDLANKKVEDIFGSDSKFKQYRNNCFADKAGSKAYKH